MESFKPTKAKLLNIWPFTVEFLNLAWALGPAGVLWHGLRAQQTCTCPCQESPLTWGPVVQSTARSLPFLGSQRISGHVMEKIKRRFKIKSPSHIGKTFQGHLAALSFGDGCGLRATPLLGAGAV